MKEKILTILREADGYVSGQELCEQLHVSRTAVWKVIGQLKEEGYEVEAVKNRGYRLMSVPDVMTGAEIQSRLHTKVMGHPCICCEEVDSTNTRAKKMAEEGAAEGLLICAEKQTEGKGRRGRAWNSPPGESVYMTLLIRPRIQPAHASMLTLVMGLAVAQACNRLLEDTLGEQAPKVGLKWPNDLVLDGRKLMGTLTEMNSEIDYINYVVIGIGINVNTTSFPEALAGTATSLYRETGRTFSRAELTALCMDYFEEDYEMFLKTEDLSGLRESYNGLLVNAGRTVCVLEPGHEYTGMALGINERGELLVKREDGTVTEVYAGEVSVRGVYGYV